MGTSFNLASSYAFDPNSGNFSSALAATWNIDGQTGSFAFASSGSPKPTLNGSSASDPNKELGIMSSYNGSSAYASASNGSSTKTNPDASSEKEAWLVSAQRIPPGQAKKMAGQKNAKVFAHNKPFLVTAQKVE